LQGNILILVVNLLQVKEFMLFFYSMDDLFFIKRALTLAVRARGKTSPNPMVGALLVKNGRIISEGYHKKAGTPHAEVIAIDRAGEKAFGSTLYVSLEPCCHKDKRTPPCTEKIISSGIRKVVIAMKDPNPKVSGKGIAELEKAGILTVAGVLEEKARQLNEAYIKYITTGTPFVVLKVAMTLDGKIATPEGESKWITGEKAREMVHRVRGSSDAVMTAIGTVKTDNPLLTCRVPGFNNPVRVIVDPHLKTRLDSHVASCPPHTIVVTKCANADGVLGNRLREKGISFIAYQGEKLDLKWLMAELGRLAITSLLIEGGSSLSSYCLEAGIVDKVMFFIAPKIMGGKDSYPAVGGRSFRRLAEAHKIKDVTIRHVGEDILIEGYIA
jgi:diaminohydroxyphosphoribosylaminopyrimidine deaminase / 5-amino-6-(5-phosphoribosylamino)uracil reductase